MIQKEGIEELLAPLIYFNIFSHPLRINELSDLLSVREEELNELLEPFVNQNICFKKDEFYGLSSEIENLVLERKKKEQRAKKYLKKLPFYTKIIASFPFVKGVAISGSLSKGVMHEDGDIDYFIITTKNRLWVCRTLLILFKKVFLLNSRKYFCVNYFIDEDNLVIKDKNVFTAIEVTHLKPVYNQSLFDQFSELNNWAAEYVQPAKHNERITCLEGDSSVKKVLENLLSGTMGEKLDLFFMRLTLKKWESKFKNFSAEKFELTMRSNRGISKHHPSDFQNKVLQAYAEKLEELNLKYESSIHA